MRRAPALDVRNLADRVTVATCAFGTCHYGGSRTMYATAILRW